MNVLSLFDGMSCAYMALHNSGIMPSRYYASEINPTAINYSKSVIPNVTHVGDVNDWRDWPDKFGLDFEKIDLLCGGSPCKGFSTLGNLMNFNHKESKLAYVMFDILHYIRKLNPNVKFLFENVVMSDSHAAIFAQNTGILHQFVNSNVVSAANRPRSYWSNIRKSNEGMFDFKTDFPAMKDRGLYFTDIYDPNPEPAAYLTDKQLIAFEKTKIRLGEPQLKQLRPLVVDKNSKVKVFALTTQRMGSPLFLIEDNGLRTLSKSELFDCQTIPQPFRNCYYSLNKINTLCGNGWTVDVITHFFSYL